MNPATTKAIRAAHEHDDTRKAVVLLAEHAITHCPDAETLDDIAALVEAALKPRSRTFGMTEPEDLRQLRAEIAEKRATVDAFCRWCDAALPSGYRSSFCSDSCEAEARDEHEERNR